MKLDNPKQHWMKGAKENIWTTCYECQTICTKNGRIGHGAIFEQHLEFDIVLLDTFDNIEMIKLHNNENTNPIVMKEL
jgi:hypothetical protein